MDGLVLLPPPPPPTHTLYKINFKAELGTGMLMVAIVPALTLLSSNATLQATFEKLCFSI